MGKGLQVARLVALALFALLAGCSTGSDPRGGQQPDVAADLRSLDRLETPAGIEADVFAQLKAALATELEHAAARGSSAIGQGLEVDDFTVTPAGGDVTLEWTYRNKGDYDQNSEVNVADLTPLGVFFHATTASANWTQAQVADGDKNGEINISDVSPLGANFRCQVTGYTLQRTLTPGDPGSWTDAATVPFSASSIPGGQPWRRFEYTYTSHTPGMNYRVVAEWTEAGGGGGGNQPPVAAFSPDVASGVSPLLVHFDAAASSDPDGSIVKFEWDWQDDGTYDFDSGATPSAQITYTVAPPHTFVARLRVTDNGGLSDTATVQIQITDPGGFVEPPVDSFVDFSQAGDSPERKWLLNAYKPLPAWQDADRVFQSAVFRDWADQVLTLTNLERANNGGLPPLTWDPHLELLAQAHARDMALQQYFAHDNLYGLDPFQRVDAVDPEPYFAAAENLFAGVDFPVENSPAFAVTGWMNSPGHRANILNPNLETLGVGVYYHTGDPSGYTAYFVQVFASFGGDPNAHDWLEPAEVN